MDKVDVTLAAIITGATAGLIEALKMGSKKIPFLKWVDGSEKLLALALPILFTIIAKLAGALGETPWEEAILWALCETGAAGIVHDKGVDPAVKGLVGFVKFLRGGKEAATPTGSDGNPPPASRE